MIPPSLRRFIPQLVLPTSIVQTLFLLSIRLYWGWQFFTTGKGKLTHLSRTAEFFSNLHIPMPMVNAALAGTTECVGGLLLLIGLGSRLVSVPLIFTMGVAYATAHRSVVFSIWEKSDDFVTAAPFLFLMACLIVLFFGPGQISIDALLRSKGSKNAKKK